ncbi:MAG: hypothetical protein KGJ79_15815 [Alphaproteobacteria bacterium]|nr:hypothetical protein [Alphaproteobacteria bacterium]MDE2112608.1 hypothetical protein [Alphaproteobacteria bacterium]MDE2494445.1 hypothetical protein [Alphaproteobacteria bacterium]
MIFRRQDGVQAARRTAATRTLAWGVAVFALLGVLCLHFAQPARADDRSSWANNGQRQIDLGRYLLTSMGDGRWLVLDRQDGDTRIVREQPANTSDQDQNQNWGGDRSQSGDRGPGDRLGRVWHEQEAGWSGLWRRRGDSGVFDAVWTGPGQVTATLEIKLDGSRKVKIERRNSSDGANCHYAGVFSDGGSYGQLGVSGQYRCGDGPLLPWSATIDR